MNDHEQSPNLNPDTSKIRAIRSINAVVDVENVRNENLTLLADLATGLGLDVIAGPWRAWQQDLLPFGDVFIMLLVSEDSFVAASSSYSDHWTIAGALHRCFQSSKLTISCSLSLIGPSVG